MEKKNEQNKLAAERRKLKKQTASARTMPTDEERVKLWRDAFGEDGDALFPEDTDDEQEEVLWNISAE